MYSSLGEKFSVMIKAFRSAVLLFAFAPIAFAQQTQQTQPASNAPASPAITGFRDAAAQQKLEEKFLAVPEPNLAREHLRILTAEPHIAGSPEDRKTADYVAPKFREAGLDVRIDT